MTPISQAVTIRVVTTNQHIFNKIKSFILIIINI